jgi:uncharacterized protein (TIGR03435 family)
MITKCAFVSLALCSILPLTAQTDSPTRDHPSFDAASVKVSKIGEIGTEGSRRESIEASPGSLTMRNVSLKSCLIWAYGVREYQIFGPAWLNDERYDITAKSAQPAPVEQLKAMLQTLLADRLDVRLHRETRELPVYVLIAGVNGPKLHRSTGNGDSEVRTKDGSLIFTNTSMSQFAEHLATIRRQVDRPVLDKTGIRGAFDFSLKFADNDADMREAMVRGEGPSVFSVVQQQLGIRLKPEQGPVEIIVIDHAQKVPTDN